MATTPDDVARAVLSAYDKRVPRPGKPQPHEWTCLAGVVAEGAAGELRVVCVASGNKCLGRSDMRPDGNVVNDCHAEVLARRAFNLALLDEIAWHVGNCRESGAQCTVGLLEHAANSVAAYRLRPHVRLHFYVSDAPCGAAAMVGAHEIDSSGTASSTEGTLGGPRRTGARPLEAMRCSVGGIDAVTTADIPSCDEPPGAAAAVAPDAAPSSSAGLRTKPGRSDLPIHRRTLSMCCSDKAARWVALGLQGALLRWWVPAPLRLSSIVVSLEAPDPRGSVASAAALAEAEDTLSRSERAALDALQRALRGRCEPAYEAAWLADVASGVGPPVDAAGECAALRGPNHWPALAVTRVRFTGGRTEASLRRSAEQAATGAGGPCSISAVMPSGESLLSSVVAVSPPDPPPESDAKAADDAAAAADVLLPNASDAPSASDSSRKRRRYAHVSGGSGSGALVVPCPTAVTALLDWSRGPSRVVGALGQQCGVVPISPPLRLPDGALSCESLQAASGVRQGRGKGAHPAAARSRLSKAALLERFRAVAESSGIPSRGTYWQIKHPSPCTHAATTSSDSADDTFPRASPHPPVVAAGHRLIPSESLPRPACACGPIRYQRAKDAFHSRSAGGFDGWLHGDPALEGFGVDAAGSPAVLGAPANALLSAATSVSDGPSLL